MLPDPAGRVKSRAAGGIISDWKVRITLLRIGSLPRHAGSGNPTVLKVVKVEAVQIVLTVIDLSAAGPGKAGDVHLGPDAWGGNGLVMIKPRPAH